MPDEPPAIPLHFLLIAAAYEDEFGIACYRLPGEGVSTVDGPDGLS